MYCAFFHYHLPPVYPLPPPPIPLTPNYRSLNVSSVPGTEVPTHTGGLRHRTLEPAARGPSAKKRQTYPPFLRTFRHVCVTISAWDLVTLSLNHVAPIKSRGVKFWNLKVLVLPLTISAFVRWSLLSPLPLFHLRLSLHKSEVDAG